MVVISSTFSPPEDGILFQTPGTKLLVDGKELGTATLYITENNVVWGGGVNTSGGAASNISLMYPNITLHAIQREPIPALFLVLGHELRLPELGQPDQDSNEDDDEDFDDPSTNLLFVPQNETDLQPMYQAMIQGQTLHPDPQDEIDDDDPYMDGEEFDEGSDEFEDAEESTPAPEDAAARLRAMRLENSNGTHADDGEDAEIGEE